MKQRIEHARQQVKRCLDLASKAIDEGDDLLFMQNLEAAEQWAEELKTLKKLAVSCQN